MANKTKTVVRQGTSTDVAVPRTTNHAGTAWPKIEMGCNVSILRTLRQMVNIVTTALQQPAWNRGHVRHVEIAFNVFVTSAVSGDNSHLHHETVLANNLNRLMANNTKDEVPAMVVKLVNILAHHHQELSIKVGPFLHLLIISIMHQSRVSLVTMSELIIILLITF